jgi:hypothetical protein
MGLIKGMKRASNERSKGTDGATELNNIGVRATELVRMAPDELKDRVLTLFIQQHDGLLKMIRSPWAIPSHLGGGGLPITETNQIRDLDRLRAAVIVKNWDRKHPKQYTNQADWKIRKIAQKRLPTPFQTESEGHASIAYERLTHTVALNLLFDSNVDIHDLVEDRGESRRDAKKIAAFNNRLWAGITGEELTHVQPLSDEGLKGAKLYDAIAVVDLNRSVTYGMKTRSVEQRQIEERGMTLFELNEYRHFYNTLDDKKVEDVAEELILEKDPEDRYLKSEIKEVQATQKIVTIQGRKMPTMQAFARYTSQTKEAKAKVGKPDILGSKRVRKGLQVKGDYGKLVDQLDDRGAF